jgi:hypothetical protein
LGKDYLKAKSKKVLSDHKRIGKRFIPPMGQIPNLTEISWRKEIIPNYLWIALLNQLYGHTKAAELCVDFANIAIQVADKAKYEGWFSAISSYCIFSDDQWEQIISLLEGKELIEYFRHAFRELVNYYPECPLKFLFNEDLDHQEDSAWLKDFKKLIEKLIDRTSEEATFVQADAIYIGFLTDKFKVPKDSPLADFPKIQEYPFTEKSKMIASGIRATINSIGGLEIKAAKFDWAGYFWNRGLEIEGCEVFYG